MSWKKVGSIKQFENFNNLNVNSIVTDDFVMREDYKGTFTISGELFVREDCSLNGNVEVGKNVYVDESVYVKDRVYIDNGSNQYRFLDNSVQGLGIDVANPQAILDISGNNNHILHVFSNQESVKSTLIQNQKENKGELQLDNSFGIFQWTFQNDNSASIVYDVSNQEFLVDKSLVVDNALLVKSNAQIMDSLDVCSNTVIGGDLDVLGTLRLEGALSLNNDLSMSGNLTVGNDATINGVLSTNDIIIGTNQGIYMEQLSNSEPILRARDPVRDSSTNVDRMSSGKTVDDFMSDISCITLTNDLLIRGNVYIEKEHNIQLENTILNSQGIFENLKGTNASGFVINQQSSVTISNEDLKGHGFYWYNRPSTTSQDAFVKISNMDADKMSFRSATNPNVVALNFSQLNAPGLSTGILSLRDNNLTQNNTNDNYEIVSSHHLSTIDVSSSLQNIFHLQSNKMHVTDASFTTVEVTGTATIEDIKCNDTLDVSYIDVSTVDASNVVVKSSLTSLQNTVLQDTVNQGSFGVSGISNFYGNAIIHEYLMGNSITISNEAIFRKDIDVYGDINAHKDISLNGNIRLQGTLFVNDNVTIGGSSSENDSLLVKQNLTIGSSTVDTNQAVTISGDISMSGMIEAESIVLRQNLNAKDISLNGNLYLNSNSLDLSNGTVAFMHDGNTYTLSAQRLSYLTTISSDIQEQIGSIKTDLDLGASEDNTFEGVNTFTNTTILHNTDVCGNVLLERNLEVQGDASLNNVVVTGNMTIESRDTNFTGDLNLIGKTEFIGDFTADNDTNDGVNTQKYEYYEVNKNGSLNILNNIKCIGQKVKTFVFRPNDDIGNINDVHSKDTDENYVDFWTVTSNGTDTSYYDNKSNIYGDLSVVETVRGGEIECNILTPRKFLTLSGDMQLRVNNNIFTPDRLVKTLNITNDNDNTLQLNDVCMNTVVINDSMTVNGPITLGGGASITAPDSNASFQQLTIGSNIFADTLEVVNIRFLTAGGQTVTSINNETTFAIYRSGLIGTSSSGILMSQEGTLANNLTRAFVYINGDLSENVFFIGKVYATGTDPNVEMKEKGNLVTNISDSEYLYTGNLFVSENASIHGTISNEILQIVHDQSGMIQFTNKATDASNQETYIPFLFSNVNKVVDDNRNNAFIETVFTDGSRNRIEIQYAYETETHTNNYFADYHNFFGEVSFNSRFDVSGDVSFNSNLDVSVNLMVNGDTDLNGRMDVSGDVSFNSNLDVSKNMIVYGTTDLIGHLDVSGDVSFNSNLDVSVNLMVNGDTDLNGRLDVSGDVSFNSNLDVLGVLKIGTGAPTTYISNNKPGSAGFAPSSIYIGSVPTYSGNIEQDLCYNRVKDTGNTDGDGYPIYERDPLLNPVADSNTFSFGLGCFQNLNNTDVSGYPRGGNKARANVAIGQSAIRDASSAFTTVAVGYEALYKAKQLLANNTAIGHLAGGTIITEQEISNNTFLGAGTGFNNDSNAYSNSTAVGYLAKIDASNQIVLGRPEDYVYAPNDVHIGDMLKMRRATNGDVISIHNGANSSQYCIGILPSTTYFTSGQYFDFIYRSAPGANDGLTNSYDYNLRVEVGNASNPKIISSTDTTEISGNLTVSDVVTANSFNANSDYRLKENIQTISGDILTVDNIRPVSYRLKSNQKSTLGFIAHEIQEHVPTAVSGEKDGETMQSVDYNQIIPILVKEIQELKKRVTYLEQNQK